MMNKRPVMIICFISIFLFSTCSHTEAATGTKKTDSSTKKTTMVKKDDENVAYLPQLTETKEGEEVAVMTTNYGEIIIRLFPEEAPKAVENFKTHSKDGYYNGVIFHRVIKDFMIQGGDPLGVGTGGESIWGNPFEDEFTPKLHCIRGALCMANSGANTNKSQFFIVQNNELDKGMKSQLEKIKANQKEVAGQDAEGVDITWSDVYPEKIIDEYLKSGGSVHLDYKHTVFGQVIEGMDVVDKIAAVPVGSNSRPKEEIVIKKIEIVKYAKSPE